MSKNHPSEPTSVANCGSPGTPNRRSRRPAKPSLKQRRLAVVLMALVAVIIWLFTNPASYDQIFTPVENTGAEHEVGNPTSTSDSLAGTSDGAPEATPGGTVKDTPENTPGFTPDGTPLATTVLELLKVKGRAPKTGYSRDEFYGGWPTVEGCNLRQKILKREFGDTAVLDGCNVVAGEFDEPYTGQHLKFTSREDISKGLQIDHVVALSDAWQKGAQYLEKDTRYQIATDPLNLLAVDSAANQQKSDGDAATWLPSNKKFRCQYVARQVSVKYKYNLWVTEAEKSAIAGILSSCPAQPTVGVSL